GGRIERPLGPIAVDELPMYCRRDDYAFLPPEPTGGIPCLTRSPSQHIDPLEMALRMSAELPPPALKIGMNPELGMVRLPTWFWAEGYDGADLGAARTMVEAHEECHFARVTDESSGAPVLERDGRPQLRRECQVRSSTWKIEVRLSPTRFTWDFGDASGREIACNAPGSCSEGLGRVFTDTWTPSPIRHAYSWTSLGKTGVDEALDAYRVSLGITFSAAFRVGIDGGALGGWRSLPERTLSWSANHRVQQAQAVLTRP
ncbi:MAG: hypothetical protein M3336_01790, partial [Chloroflexota bacterium]|nr:hypothetical protein [Chloroflexota bacterium]